jgi:4-amino-4-deoxy-L-arabinose transferase-like glycosyltransferase
VPSPAKSEAHRLDSRWGGPKAALGAILAGALALRLVGIEYGLPLGGLLNPDELSIVPRAWAMVHGGGLDPDPFFDYPSLLLYVLAPFQAWESSPSYLAARLVIAVLGLAGVGAAWWLGARAYGTLAGGVAAAATAVATVHVAYSHMAVTDVPLALATTVALALAVSGRLELAGLAAGAATGVKYAGAFLVVALVAAGWAHWRRLAVSLALMALAFVATSPFVLAHPGEAWEDFSRVQRLARAGWLGFEHDGSAPVAFLDRLWDSLGPALLIAGAGLSLALVRRRRADLVLASFSLVYFVDLFTLDAHFDRYVLPLVPALGALAGRIRPLAPVTLLLLVVPLTWSVQDDRELTRTDTRVVADRWIDRHLPRSAAVAVDPSAPPLDGYRLLRLELPGPGRRLDPNRDVARLRDRGVRYVVVTGSVTDRVLAAADRYPREAAFYRRLSREPRVFFRRADGDLAGPWVAVYRLN